MKKNCFEMTGIAVAAAVTALLLCGQGASAQGNASAEETKKKKKQVMKVVGRNWKQIEPCIDLFAVNHADAVFFVIRFEVEPGGRVAGIFTNPSDDAVENCFDGALSGMDMPEVEEEIDFKFKIDLPKKPKPAPEEEVEKLAPDTGEGIVEKKADHAKKRPPAYVPVGAGKMYVYKGDIIGSFHLMRVLKGFDASVGLAKKSRDYVISGIAMEVLGVVCNLAGAVFFGYGLSELLSETQYYKPESWAKGMTIAGGVLLGLGIIIDITGTQLMSKGWAFLATSVKAYNMTDPEHPIYPPGY
ncbi:MAG: hypothetical protein ABIJ56_21650 [Pseudomonadota bacterium]